VHQQSGRTDGNFKGIGIYTTTERREKTALVYTDSRITLQLLKNHERHTHIIDQIKNKVMDMERDEWKVEFSWVMVHVGRRGNELADRLAKEASSSKDIKE
jgi:ribonuclease HI